MKWNMSMRSFASLTRKVHKDESGEAGIQVTVMKLAIAALVVIALIAFGNELWDWLQELWQRIRGSSVG